MALEDSNDGKHQQHGHVHSLQLIEVDHDLEDLTKMNRSVWMCLEAIVFPGLL